MMAEEHLLRADIPLLELLVQADPDDLANLVDYLTQHGHGRWALKSHTKRTLLAAAQRKQFSRQNVALIIYELEHFGGNALVNTVRRSGVPYHVIVRDVAAHLRIKDIDAQTSIEVIEQRILESMLEHYWEQLPQNEKSRFSRMIETVTLGRKIEPAKLKEILRSGKVNWRAIGGVVSDYVIPNVRRNYRHYLGTIGTVGTKTLSAGKWLAASPYTLPLVAVGAAATAASYGLYRVSGEAYRVTVPCVAQIATIRQKVMEADST